MDCFHCVILKAICTGGWLIRSGLRVQESAYQLGVKSNQVSFGMQQCYARTIILPCAQTFSISLYTPNNHKVKRGNGAIHIHCRCTFARKRKILRRKETPFESNFVSPVIPQSHWLYLLCEQSDLKRYLRCTRPPNCTETSIIVKFLQQDQSFSYPVWPLCDSIANFSVHT